MSTASVLASDEQIAQWKRTVRSAGLGVRLSAAPSEGTAWPLVLHALMSAVGPLRDLQASALTLNEITALEVVSADDLRGRWSLLPTSTQQLWLTMLVARLRALQQHASATNAIKARLDEVVRRSVHWSRAHMPGHVHGLQSAHRAMSGSWALDARVAWSALDRLLGEGLAVRSATAPAKKAKRVHTERARDAAIDPSWRVFPLVRDRKAVMVGGDPRETHRVRIERAFDLASLDWPSIEGQRKVEATAESIRARGYGLVIVVAGFVAHKQSDVLIQAARDAAVPWALASGYGLSAVKLALERFFAGPRPSVGRT